MEFLNFEKVSFRPTPTFKIYVQNWVDASDRLQVLQKKSSNSVKEINFYVLFNKYINWVDCLKMYFT